MIVMINGAFGVGKTSAAEGLVKKIPNSIIYDPEEVGFMLRNIIPRELKVKDGDTSDFQELELWRKLTVTVASDLIKKYNVNLIVPMTIYKKEYFDYIYNGLKKIDDSIYHFCLTASLDTIHKRLEKRGDIKGSWAYEQTSKCLKAYKEYNFNEYIDTEICTAKELVDSIFVKVNANKNCFKDKEINN